MKNSALSSRFTPCLWGANAGDFIFRQRAVFAGLQRRIVQNPGQNGQRYYLEVMQDYEKALKLNPDNQLAKQLQQKFFEGMKQQTGK